MSDIDHLLSYPSEADALADATLSPWIKEGEWDRSRSFPGVELVTREDPRTVFPGWWICISTEGEAPDDALVSIEACRMVANRDAGARGEAFIYSDGLRAQPEQIASVLRIDGLPAGSAYPFSAPRVRT